MHLNKESNTLEGFFKLTLADFIVRSAYQMGKTPLLPLFAAALGASDAFLGVIVSVSTLTGMLLKPAIGFLSDRSSRRIWLIIGTLFFTFMPFLYWLIETPEQLFVIRLIHGMATAIYGPVTLAYIAGKSKKRLAEKLGWFGLAREGGYIVGPALAGLLLLIWSPPMVFTLVGILSALAFIPILSLPEPPPLKQKPLKEQLTKGLKTLQQSAALWLAGALECVNYMVLYALKAFLPIYALSAGINVALIGAFFAVQEGAHIILKPFTGRLADRFTYLPIICLGMCLLGVSVLWLMQSSAILIFFIAAVLSGAAQALIFPASLALVANQVQQESLGLSMGLVGSFANAGKILGPVLAGLLIQRFDYRQSFQILSYSLIAVAIGLFLIGRIRLIRSSKGIVGGTD